MLSLFKMVPLDEDRFERDEDRFERIEKRLARIEDRLLDLEKDVSFDARRDAATRRFNVLIRIGVYTLGLLLIIFLFFLLKWGVIYF